MKKAFLYAYDKANLGDDLFVRTIANRYPRVKFYLWSDKRNRAVFKENKNIKIIDKESFFLKILYQIGPSLVARYQDAKKKKCDAVIYIGGSIFMEYPTWRNVVNWWKYQSEHYPFYVIGANFGPYETEQYREEMEKIFDNMKDVCFRDKYSYRLFEKNPNVHYAPDILFSYPLPKIEKKKKQVFVSVINCEIKEDGKYIQYKDFYEKSICRILEYFQERKYEIKIASFCKEEGDEIAAQRIAKQFNGKTELICYDGENEKDILYKLAESKYVVATRFHAMVLGLSAGSIVFPILYSDKSKHVLDDIGYGGDYLRLQNTQDFILSNSVENQVQQLGDIPKKSKDHFIQLDKQLLVE